MFSFKKFSDIETVNTRMLYNLQCLDKCIEWVGLNKIDGSNFQIATDGKGSIKFGKRSSYLGDDNLNFGGLETILKEDFGFNSLLGCIEKSERPLIFFGEIYGGYYVHPDVACNSNVYTKVQKRVCYSPKNHFILFDIFDVEANEYLAENTVRIYASSFGFDYPHEMVCGSLEDVMGFSVDFIDPTHLLHGLPQATVNFKSEGIVCKPRFQSLRFGNSDRVIFKRKSDSFAETKSAKEVKEISPETKERAVKFLACVTESRLLSVISKETTNPTFKEFGKYLGLFLDDIEKDVGEVMDKDIRKIVGNEAGIVLRKYLATI